LLYFRKTPGWLKKLFPQATWNFDDIEKKIFLTFDDGPIPELTPWVLDTLKEFDARATFFYVGNNIKKHPELFKRASDEGHSIGNHTFNHLKGWRTSHEDYMANIALCEAAIVECGGGGSAGLFRPPYGQLTFALEKKISANYRIIMWDYLTGDFDQSLSPEKCHAEAIKGTKPGSIVIYHENVKAEARIKYSLPKFLDHFSSLGYEFCAID
jgi:peptidoglycan-N-acetylglucosamine deacetylase